jgi:acyl-coenzyme A synthetase/AMP-(fatty) acid ligase
MLSLSDTRSTPACPAPFSLAHYVLGRAVDLPDKVALEILNGAGAECWRYGQLDRAVRGVAFGLARLQLAAGDRILLRLGNSVDFPLAFLGAIGAGYLPVVAPAGLTVPEVTALARETGPALVVGGPGLALPDIAGLRVLTATDLREMTAGPEGRFEAGDPDRPGYLVYTSGTSGKPRAVVHAHRAVWARRSMWQGWYGLEESDRMLHAGALNWTFTLGTGLFDPWAAGATALIPDGRLTPDRLPALIEQHEATLFAAAPGVYRKILKSGAPLLMPRLRHGLSAGERLPEETRAAWVAGTGKPLYEAYGLSECSTMISGAPARPAPPGATGYAQKGRRIAIVDDLGRPVERGSTGNLAIHRQDPGLFLSYFAHEGERAARFAGDWFITGDLGRMAQDGAITCLGRADDMMNAGGYRVSPGEVEEALALCDGAGQVAAAEVHVNGAVTIIAAFYTGTASAEALGAHAERTLAPHKRPRAYHHRATLPMTANGKVNRRLLREEYGTR